jgi:hypothetical protein
MPGTGRTGTKRKSKAPVPKPPRGSGLNPSGLPANDQLNRPSERLRDPDHMFNPHDSPPRFDIGDDGNFDVGALYGRDGKSACPHTHDPTLTKGSITRLKHKLARIRLPAQLKSI